MISSHPLLARLDGVRSTGPGRWTARCPVHEDRRASLSIRLTDDGRTLLYDFGGCRTEEILRARGLDWGALFPDRDQGSGIADRRRHFSQPPRRRPETEMQRAWREVLERDRLAAEKRAEWLPYWRLAEGVREHYRVADALRADVTATQADDNTGWALLEHAAGLERHALTLEAELDAAVAARHLR